MFFMEGRSIFDPSSIPLTGEESFKQAKVGAQGGVLPIWQILLGVPSSRSELLKDVAWRGGGGCT